MDEKRVRTELHVPFMTLLKISLFALLVLCVITLWPFILMLLVAVLLAIALEPVVGWLGRHRVNRSVAVAMIAVALLGALFLFFGVLLPHIGQQVGELTRSLTAARKDVAQRVPEGLRPVRDALERPGTLLPKGSLEKWLQTSLVVGKVALEGVVGLFFTLAVTLYLLLEGKSFYAWLVSFVPRTRRDRVAQTAEEVSGVVLAYMRGQFLTSLLCAVYVFVLLLVLRVPGALLLAVAAGIFDIIPVFGTLLLVLLPTFVAFTVSPGRGLIVLAALTLYHFIESYLIVPKIYGRQMRLSTLAVLLAVTVGGALQGIIGMVLVLPLVAAYPIIERLWLRPLVGSDTVTDHQRLEKDESGTAADDIART